MKIVDDMASHDSTRTLKKGQKQQRMELKKTHIGKELPSSYFFAIVQVEKKRFRSEILCEIEATWTRKNTLEWRWTRQMWRKRRAIESKAMNLRGKINRIKFYDHQSDSASVGWVSLCFYWLSTASLSLIGLQTRQCAPFCWPEWKHTNPGLMGEMFGKSAEKKHRDERKERWNGHKNLGC